MRPSLAPLGSALLGTALLGLGLIGCGPGDDAVLIGSKNFTESVLLGEIVAQQLEGHGVPVERTFNLGGTFVAHRAITAGQLDLYVEYTGTAYAAILGLEGEKNPSRVSAIVDSVYRQRWQLRWMPPLGFDNTFAMLVRRAEADSLGIRTLSQARPYAREWTPGAGYEFADRADGLEGLLEAYGLEFAGPPAVMELGLTYRALADGEVDIIAGNSTDGQIVALDLFHLEDDRDYFPPYEAAPVVRQPVLERFPAIAGALDELRGSIDEEEMRRLNYLVDVEGRTVREVAAEFLKGLPGG